MPFDPTKIGEISCSDADGRVRARGVLQGRHNVLIRAGSTALGSVHHWVNSDYETQGYITRRDGVYYFLKDCPFGTPSEAAKFVRNTSTADGPGIWKDKDGQSLRQRGMPARAYRSKR